MKIFTLGLLQLFSILRTKHLLLRDKISSMTNRTAKTNATFACGIIFKSSSMLPKLINKLDEILLRNQMVLRHKVRLIVSQMLKREGELLCLVFLYQYQIASTASPVATILTKLKLQFILPVSVKKCNHMENKERSQTKCCS